MADSIGVGGFAVPVVSSNLLNTDGTAILNTDGNPIQNTG